MKKIAVMMVVGAGLLFADNFMDVPNSSKSQGGSGLSQLDKTIMDLRKSSKNSDMGFFVDARAGKVLGSASAGLPKATIQKNIYTKPKAHKENAADSKGKVKYEMSVEKIPLM